MWPVAGVSDVRSTLDAAALRRLWRPVVAGRGTCVCCAGALGMGDTRGVGLVIQGWASGLHLEPCGVVHPMVSVKPLQGGDVCPPRTRRMKCHGSGRAGGCSPLWFAPTADAAAG